MNWYVLYTKPRWERKTAGELERMGIQVYCPVITTVRQWSDRKKKVTAPLFTSYIFVRLKEKDRNQVFAANGVVRYLFWLGKPAIVRDQEIETIERWLNNDMYEDIQVRSFQRGERVEIQSGPMKGQKGVVKEVRKKEIRLVLESLGYVVTIQLREVQ